MILPLKYFFGIQVDVSITLNDPVIANGRFHTSAHFRCRNVDALSPIKANASHAQRVWSADANNLERIHDDRISLIFHLFASQGAPPKHSAQAPSSRWLPGIAVAAPSFAETRRARFSHPLEPF